MGQKPKITTKENSDGPAVPVKAPTTYPDSSLGASPAPYGGYTSQQGSAQSAYARASTYTLGQKPQITSKENSESTAVPAKVPTTYPDTSLRASPAPYGSNTSQQGSMQSAYTLAVNYRMGQQPQITTKENSESTGVPVKVPTTYPDSSWARHPLLTVGSLLNKDLRSQPTL